MLTPFELFAQI